MLSVRSAVAVLPSRAMTVIMLLLTTKWPEIVLPFASLKFFTHLFSSLPSSVSLGRERTTFVHLAGGDQS